MPDRRAKAFQCKIRSNLITNTQIQIHKYKYTKTNTQIHIHKYIYTNTNTQIQLHKYKYKYTNTNIQIQRRAKAVQCIIRSKVITHLSRTVFGFVFCLVMPYDKLIITIRTSIFWTSNQMTTMKAKTISEDYWIKIDPSSKVFVVVHALNTSEEEAKPCCQIETNAAIFNFASLPRV